MNDASRIQVVHGGREPARVLHAKLPPAPQVRGALERPVLARLGELGDLPRRPRIFVELELRRAGVFRVAQRVTSGSSRTHEHLAEDAALPTGPVHPRGESFARPRREAFARRLALRASQTRFSSLIVSRARAAMRFAIEGCVPTGAP